MKSNRVMVLQAKFIKVIIGCIVFCSITPVYSATPWLHTEGNEIQDPAGNQVILRGVALIDIGIVELERGGVIALINRLTDKTDTQGSSEGWYPKVIRLAVYPSDQGGGGSWSFDDDPDYYYNNLLRPVVDYCKSKDLYVIIDWHYIANTNDHVASTSAFWNYIAPKFANDSHVIFELFNEPTNSSSSWSVVKSNMQTWINIIRPYAPNNLILVGGPQWCQIMTPQITDPVIGDNIVYVTHIYPAHWLGTYYVNIGAIANCAAVHPVIMTEWGFRITDETLLNGTVTNYGQPLMNFLEQNKISNTAWCADYDWRPPMFYSDWTLRCGDGEMGCFVKDTLYLRRNDDQPSDLASNEPKPADGATDVPRNAVVSWEPGAFAVGHDVYFGTSEANVTDANRSNPMDVLVSTNQDPCTYDPCGLFATDTNYYLRVDEVNSTQIWPGNVWEFKTGNGLAVEGFDSYTDNGTLQTVWGANLNSGADVSLETVKIHSGKSMKYYYQNIGSSGYYSEVDVNTLSLPSGIGSDWTIGGVKALALYFYGQSGNSNEPMYVRLTDGNSSATVTYGEDGEDANDVRNPWWQQWDIALSDFAGVDLNNVKKITIGFGDEAGPDTEGTVYFDDIRLYPPRHVPDKSTADVNGDCFVDYVDLGILADYWLVPVSATAPGDANLVGKWMLDADSCDTSGYNNNGTLIGRPDWVPGRHADENGRALEFIDADADYVNCGTAASLNLTTTGTVAAWIQTDNVSNSQINTYVSKGHRTTLPVSTAGSYGIWDNASNKIEFFIYEGTTLYSAATAVDSSFNGVWHHVAGTYDGSQIKLYIDGQLKATTTHAGTINTNAKRLLMGASEAGDSSNQTYYYDGKIDEVRIYSRALSQAEIMYLAEKHVDLNRDGIVNIRDFSSLAAKWLEEDLWP